MSTTQNRIIPRSTESGVGGGRPAPFRKMYIIYGIFRCCTMLYWYMLVLISTILPYYLPIVGGWGGGLGPFRRPQNYRILSCGLCKTSLRFPTRPDYRSRWATVKKCRVARTFAVPSTHVLKRQHAHAARPASGAIPTPTAELRVTDVPPAYTPYNINKKSLFSY